MWWLDLCWEKNSLLTGSSFMLISLPPVLCSCQKMHFMGGFECLTQAFLKATNVPLNLIPQWERLGNSLSNREVQNLFGFDKFKSLFFRIQTNLTLGLWIPKWGVQFSAIQRKEPGYFLNFELWTVFQEWEANKQGTCGKACKGQTDFFFILRFSLQYLNIKFFIFEMIAHSLLMPEH